MADKILLTGGSGVIGRELAPLLPKDRLVLARHRTPLDSAARQFLLDIRQPGLGLSDSDHAVLADEVGTIIHCAAITDMAGISPELAVTNIDGVRHMINFAQAAGAHLIYVSTAYCSRQWGPKAGEGSAYVQSKRAAEDLVQASEVPWTIVRPSIVAGHSTSGEIAQFQGFHLFIAAMLKGRMPLIPIDKAARCDFVPADDIARGIAAILQGGEAGQTYWLTSGERALTITEMMDVGQPFAHTLGRDLNALPVINPETAAREHLPALRERLPRRLLERVEVLMELASVMATPKPFPSDLETLCGTVADLRSTLDANIRHWGRTSRLDFSAIPRRG